ncbi:hypothetical protein Tco_0014885 [Tanacetum coccineum]
MLDSQGPILGLTTTRALVTIQEMADHSHKWHDEERTGEYNSNWMNTIIDKLKIPNHNMRNLNENVHTIKGRYVSGDEMHYLLSEEVKFVKTTEYKDDSLRGTPGKNSPSRNSSKLKEILGKYLHDSGIKGLEENIAGLAQAVKTHDKLNRDKTFDMKSGTIISLTYDNSNLAYGLGTPKPISIVIEMADMSMQYPKGIVKNVLVKIDKFISPVRKITRDLGDFFEENDLLAKIDWDTLEVIPDSDNEIRIRLEDLGKGI